MKDGISAFIVGVLVIAGIMAITWAIQGNDFFMYKFFGPKYEQTRREIFEQSKAYNQGMIQELQSLQLDHAKGNVEQKAAIRSIVLHRYADFDDSKLPGDLRIFVSRMRGGE